MVDFGSECEETFPPDADFMFGQHRNICQIWDYRTFSRVHSYGFQDGDENKFRKADMEG
jgi:hypothetical protein